MFYREIIFFLIMTQINKLNKIFMKKIINFLIIMALVSSCVQPEVGYMSDNIHALQDTIFVPRGVFLTTPPPAIEGSTYPLHWEITDITDAGGNLTNELLDTHEILTWKEAFNPNTDTTLELAEAKLELTEHPSILLNDVSGQFAFTQASKFVDNDIFHVNMKASNVRGERQLDNFTVIKMQPFLPVEFPVEMRSRLNLVKAAGGLSALQTVSIKNGFDDNVPSVLDGTHSHITITKISDEPSLGVKVKMIIADSYGTTLDPSKVLFYPSGASYLQNFHDNSVETVTDSEGTIFSLPAPPFPQYSRNGWGDLMYYITSRDAFTVDTEAWEAENGTKDWTPFMNSDNEIVNQAYIRWGIKINDSGTWEIKMRIPYTKVKE